MEKPISLSVVVCTYNGAKYLQPQLESLLRQTLMPTEILIHDDGSTDGTLDIAHAYAERFPIIRVVKNEGRHGVNTNFFAALYKASGDFIAICDQDDIWEPTKLEHQYAAIGDALLIGGLSVPFAESAETPVDADTRLPNIDLLRMMYVGMMPGHTQLLRRELLDFLPDCEWFMYDLQTQATAAALERVAYLPEVVVHQRRHVSAATYMKPHSRKRSLKNILCTAVKTLRIYRDTRPHVKHRFNEWLKFFDQIDAETPSLLRAKKMAVLQVADGPWAFLKLMVCCYRNRTRLFHTVEADGWLTRARALYFPISCAGYYEYLIGKKD